MILAFGGSSPVLAILPDAAIRRAVAGFCFGGVGASPPMLWGKMGASVAYGIFTEKSAPSQRSASGQ